MTGQGVHKWIIGRRRPRIKSPVTERRLADALPVDILERTSTLSPRAFRVLLAIERFCRMDWRCWPSNRESPLSRGAKSQVRSCLSELADAGWIYCMLTPDKRTRGAILMRTRLDPDLPAMPPEYRGESVTDTPAGIRDQTWHGYLEVRRAIKNPVTTLPEKFLVVRRLEELQRQGHAPDLVLREAILHGSSALLPLRS